MKNYSIKLHKRVSKFLKKCPQHIKIRFVEKIELMKKNPFDSRCDIVKLENTDTDFRLRIGDYRFFFTIINQDITIYFFDAWARGDVYK